MCSVSTRFSEYSSKTLLATKRGLCVSGVRIRNIEKHPGRQVTEPNRLSNALAKKCEMKYSYTCYKEIIVSTRHLLALSPSTNLQHRDKSLLRIAQASLSTKTNDLFVVGEGTDEAVETQRLYFRIGIDLQDVLVKARINTDDILDLMVYFQLHGCHWRAKVDLIEESHEDQL